MKKHYFLFFSFLLFASFIKAQDFAVGCNGNRYIDDIFTETQLTEGVVFGEAVNSAGMTQTLKMDIFEPVGDTETERPMIIMAFGGSFIFGDRTQMHDVCEFYARKGYVAASIDYRLWNLFTQGVPDSLGILDVVVKAVHDMKASVRYLRSDAAANNTFGIDSDIIMVGGVSAGGIAACQTGMMDESDDIPQFIRDIIEDNGGIEGMSGNPGISSEVQGVINMSGGMYDVTWLDENDPPILSMHGTADPTVPYGFGLANGIMTINGSGNVHIEADAEGVPNYLVTVPDGGHIDIYSEPIYLTSQEEFNTQGMAFLESVLCGVTNTKEISADIDIQITPNPATDQAVLHISDVTETYDIQVFNQIGQLVYSKFDNVNSQVTLSKSDIGTGLYFVQIRLADSNSMRTETVVFE